MYAVIETGGKQYKVAENEIIQVEKLDGEAGDTVSLDKVLMLDDGKSVKIGTPTVKGAAVTAEILEQGRGRKILIFKKKRRKNYRRTRGHRQAHTVLRITSLTGEKKAAAKKPAAKKAADGKAKPAAKKTTAKKPAAKKSASKPTAKKTPAKKTAAKAGAKKTGKSAAGKSAAKKTAAKKGAAKTKAKKPAAKKSAAKGSK